MKKIITTITLLSLMAVGSTCIAANHHAKQHHAHHVTTAQNTQTININTADVEALSTLKGIGAKKAAAIVAYREQQGKFKTLNQLAKVKGIGNKMIERVLKNNPGRLVVS